MNLFVDTSVWSLAFRRDNESKVPEVLRLRQALEGQGAIYTTGLVLQELLQGFHGPKDSKGIVKHFSALPVIIPERDDHIEAAILRNHCRRKGVQVGTIDALLAQLCIRHGLRMLSCDNDFDWIAEHSELVLS